MPGGIDGIVKEVLDGAAALAKKEGEEYAKAARSDAKDLIERLRADLERWTKGVADGALTPAEFASLVRGKRDLARMRALLQKGLAKAAVERIVNGTLDLVIAGALGAG